MSRARILEAIRRNKPAEAALPSIPDFRDDSMDLIKDFNSQLNAGGGRLVEVSSMRDAVDTVRELTPDGSATASPVDGIGGNVALVEVRDLQALADIDIAVLHGQIGVAENGSVWLTEKECVHRVLPFIVSHLILLLPRRAIVENMHVAYERIRLDGLGFGVFVAGPSKTADIEQALVIGAQGPRELTVILYAHLADENTVKSDHS